MVSLSFDAPTDVTVDYATADGTAVDGLDFVGTSGSLFIPVGQSSGEIVIPILDDGLVEGEERFTLTLDNPQGAALRDDDTATVTINDDELLPVIAQPGQGRIYRDGDLIEMDATPSVVPTGFETWFAALRDNGGDPMDPAYLATGLTGEFTLSGLDDGYLVRLVIAAPGSMPDDGALRGRTPPCLAGIPGAPCASAEVEVVKATSSQPTGFRVVHAFPEQVMLVWANPSILTLERSVDGGETWSVLGLTETVRYYQNADLVEGATYHYRGRGHVTAPWTYLGDTTASPGQPVEIPVWDAPRILPQLDDVTWHCPSEAVRPLCEGTLHLRLQAEPGTGSLAGATIRVYLNEETFELEDGAGDEIHTEFNVSEDNYLLPFRGYDLPACVVRNPAPDLEVVVPDELEEVAVDLENVIYGANGLRFEVETPSGAFSERALLIAALDEPVQDDHAVEYSHFTPVLFGNLITTNDPIIEGVGPAGRHSPDCVDGDSWYFFDKSPRGYNTALFFNEINFAGVNDRYIWTDATGAWASSYTGVPDGVYQLETGPPNVWPDWGMLGREISRPGGGFFTDDYETEVSTESLGPNLAITIDSTVTDLAPQLQLHPRQRADRRPRSGGGQSHPLPHHRRRP